MKIRSFPIENVSSVRKWKPRHQSENVLSVRKWKTSQSQSEISLIGIKLKEIILMTFYEHVSNKPILSVQNGQTWNCKLGLTSIRWSFWHRPRPKLKITCWNWGQFQVWRLGLNMPWLECRIGSFLSNFNPFGLIFGLKTHFLLSDWCRIRFPFSETTRFHQLSQVWENLQLGLTNLQTEMDFPMWVPLLYGLCSYQRRYNESIFSAHTCRAPDLKSDHLH